MIRMSEKTASHGQCILGARRLFVKTDGSFNPCERLISDFIIGNVDDGIDFNKVYVFFKDWSNLFSDICNDCWAIRFCSKCTASFESNNHFKDLNLKQFCSESKNAIEKNLVLFCTFQEQDEHFLELFENVKVG